jgi:hypothetical protein
MYAYYIGLLTAVVGCIDTGWNESQLTDRRGRRKLSSRCDACSFKVVFLYSLFPFSWNFNPSKTTTENLTMKNE